MNALRFNVAGLLKELTGAAREYVIHAPPDALDSLLDGSDGFRPDAPIDGQVRLLRTPRGIFARGHITTQVVVECSRCLAGTPVPVAFDLEVEYFPQVDISTGGAVTLPDDDELGFTIESNHELDLSEPLRQHLLLELPMQALCRESCKGLCVQCGADLNDGPCACPAEVEDPRLTRLRGLLGNVQT